MNIFKYADLALGHLSADTIKFLGGDNPEVCCYPFQHGLFVYVTEGYSYDEVKLPSDLQLVFKWARANNATLIKFDEEGFVIDELPLYGGTIPKELEEQISRCCK